MTLTIVTESERQAMIAEADARHAQWPQYANHWDAWLVGRVTRDVRTKLGVAFRKGDIVLVDPEPFTEKTPNHPIADPRPYADWDDVEYRTCYSSRNGIDTAVNARYVQIGEVH